MIPYISSIMQYKFYMHAIYTIVYTDIVYNKIKIILGRHLFLCPGRAAEYIWLYASHGHHRVASPGFELGTLDLKA